MSLVEVARQLSDELRALQFGPPVHTVYNPVEYAFAPHQTYLERYGQGPKRAVLVGMNPGPWGMAQTGVPFGEVGMVRDWLKLCLPVERPHPEHPKRPIQGCDCPKSEVSGRRLWGWAKNRFQSPEAFFSQFFVLNYCPLVFMEESGKNRTPDKLPKAEREPLEAACDRALRANLALLSPKWAIGVGSFAEKCLKRALEGQADAPEIKRVLHPSPANPAANRGWEARVEDALASLGVWEA